MAVGSVALTCPGCQTKDRHAFKIPTPNGTTQLHYWCVVCGSEIKAVIQRADSPGNVKVDLAVRRPSKLLQAMREEEENDKITTPDHAESPEAAQGGQGTKTEENAETPPPVSRTASV